MPTLTRDATPGARAYCESGMLENFCGTGRNFICKTDPVVPS